MKMLFTTFIILITTFSINAKAAGCHTTAAKMITDMVTLAHENSEISDEDLAWMNDNSQWPAARAEGNNFSCSTENTEGLGETVVSSLLLSKNPPDGIAIIISDNRLALLLAAGGPN